MKLFTTLVFVSLALLISVKAGELPTNLVILYGEEGTFKDLDEFERYIDRTFDPFLFLLLIPSFLQRTDAYSPGTD